VEAGPVRHHRARCVGVAVRDGSASSAVACCPAAASRDRRCRHRVADACCRLGVPDCDHVRVAVLGPHDPARAADAGGGAAAGDWPATRADVVRAAGVDAWPGDGGVSRLANCVVTRIRLCRSRRRPLGMAYAALLRGGGARRSHSPSPARIVRRHRHVVLVGNDSWTLRTPRIRRGVSLHLRHGVTQRRTRCAPDILGRSLVSAVCTSRSRTRRSDRRSATRGGDHVGAVRRGVDAVWSGHVRGVARRGGAPPAAIATHRRRRLARG
jgi:hypothetical protein